jgi:5-methylcytosine-specific restriction enzyme subunit McrC
MTTEAGPYKLMELSDKNMNLLYERFILEYYKKHHPYLRPNARTIHWLLEEGSPDYLPIMQTDTTLQFEDKTLIIDAKYYGQSMRKSFDKRVYHSHNLYQIFSYVKNLDKDQSGGVSGMLLYAKTSERVTPDEDLVISGNKISIKTLDLNQSFQAITEELDALVSY